MTFVVEFVSDTVMRDEFERDALVALAADVFGELGFRPALLAELAARSGMSVRHIRCLFPGGKS